MKDIKIFVSCHTDSYVPKSDILVPVQVGAALTKQRFPGMVPDDTGDHISEKNRSFCELTAHYWAWKNVQADYYGFYHYRRYISFSDEILGEDSAMAEIDYLSQDNLELIRNTDDCLKAVIPNYDIITIKPRDLGERTIWAQFEGESVHEIEDLQICLDIIKSKWPQYYDTAFHYWNSNQIYYCNMHITQKAIFEQYSAWLFSILDEFLIRKNIEEYSPAKYRVVGYLAERLWGVFYLFNKRQHPEWKCFEGQRIHIKYTHKMDVPQLNTTMPVLPIVLSSSEYFLPFVDVLIQSIMANSNSEFFYDFIVLNGGLSAKSCAQSLKAVKKLKNMSLRFLNITPAMKHQLKTRNHVPVQTWYRLFTPYILKEYSKIIYLDSDVVVDDDISEIFKIDLQDKLIAATRDTRVIASSYTFPRRKEYCEENLTIEDIHNYFQAGVLVMNLDEFRRRFSLEQLLDTAMSQDWELMDQDMLNSIIPNESVYYLPQRWDYVVDYKGRCQPWLNNLPHHLYDMHMEAVKSPAVIHYGGPYKPWSHEDIDEFTVFWKYARKSDFYEYILMRSMSEKFRSVAKKNRSAGPKRRYVSQRKGPVFDTVNKLLPERSKRRQLVKRVLGFTR